MASWNEVVTQIKEVGNGYDVVRRQALKTLAQKTQRNVIAYYSGWLQKGNLADRVGPHFSLGDNDKNGFMAAIHKMDRTLGLDLILHTPGGDAAATESLVDYLRSMFKTDIRVIVPQLAMSAGSMIACAAKAIIMGKHSSLGPVDPQIGGLPAHGIIEEFNRAKTEIAANPKTIPAWQAILAKYPPTLIGECEKAITWSGTMVKEWLKTGMFENDPDKEAKANKVFAELGDHALTLSHARHISLARAQGLGLNIIELEKDPDLQDAVLTAHHSYIQTLTESPAIKVIENHLGVALILSFQHQ